MLIRRAKMVIALNTRFFSPSAATVAETNYNLLRSFPSHTLSRVLNSNLLRAHYATHSHAISVDAAAAASRIDKIDAQAALFDYLHVTRGMSFQDADHISKNSPRFLADLILMVEGEHDVSKGLSKFFRYNPINEFEPFFESLGLSPAEFTSLLPRGLIFLDDDRVLLDNYQALVNYGVPRSNIGKMYKQAPEIFRYGIGELDVKLRAYGQLGLSQSTVVKVVSLNPLLLVGEMDKAFVGVLEMFKNLGLGSIWIEGFLSVGNERNWKRILDTLYFLRWIGYNDAQMRDLCMKDIALLIEGSGKQVYVMVGALLKLGMNKKEVFSLVLKTPEILSHQWWQKNFWKALRFLFEIGMEPENVTRILSSHVKLFGSHSVRALKTVLMNFSGDKCSLCQAMKNDEAMFSKLVLKSKSCSAESIATRNRNSALERVQFLLRIGYVENSDEMVKAMRQFRGRGDQLQERFDCLVRAGLDFNTVVDIVKRTPTMLNQSKEVLEEKIECLKEYMGYPVESIVGSPSYLLYDLGRIRARFCMYLWAREKGVARDMLSVSTLVTCAEGRFVKYFVNVHPEGPAVWESIKQRELAAVGDESSNGLLEDVQDYCFTKDISLFPWREAASFGTEIGPASE